MHFKLWLKLFRLAKFKNKLILDSLVVLPKWSACWYCIRQYAQCQLFGRLLLRTDSLYHCCSLLVVRLVLLNVLFVVCWWDLWHCCIIKLGAIVTKSYIFCMFRLYAEHIGWPWSKWGVRRRYTAEPHRFNHISLCLLFEYTKLLQSDCRQSHMPWGELTWVIFNSLF